MNRKPAGNIIIIPSAGIDETCGPQGRTGTRVYCHQGVVGYRTTLPVPRYHGYLGTPPPRTTPATRCYRSAPARQRRRTGPWAQGPVPQHRDVAPEGNITLAVPVSSVDLARSSGSSTDDPG